MLWKELPKLYVLDTRKISWFLSRCISSIICVIEIDFYCPFLIFNLFIYFFVIRRGGCHWQGAASGPKSHIGRSKKWHWQGRKVTQGPKCDIGVFKLSIICWPDPLNWHTFRHAYVAIWYQVFFRKHIKSPLKDRQRRHVLIAYVSIITSQCRCTWAISQITNCDAYAIWQWK